MSSRASAPPNLVTFRPREVSLNRSGPKRIFESHVVKQNVNFPAKVISDLDCKWPKIVEEMLKLAPKMTMGEVQSARRSMSRDRVNALSQERHAFAERVEKIAHTHAYHASILAAVALDSFSPEDLAKKIIAVMEKTP